MLKRPGITIENYEAIFEVFVSDLYQAIPLPPELTQEMWNNITWYDTFMWFFNFGGDIEGNRLVTSPILEYYLTSMDAVVNNQTYYPS